MRFPAKKLTALLTVLGFVWTSFFWPTPSLYAGPVSAQGEAPLTELFQLRLPAELGTVQEHYIPGRANGDPLIIHVQDAHAVYDAQKNIQGIIDHLQKLYHLPLVAVEGAVGNLDPILFRSFPSEDVKQRIFDGLIRKGEISGVDAAAVLNSGWSEFVGIEDRELYLADREAYIEAIKSKEELEGKLETRSKKNRELKAKVYSAKLLELDRQLERFEENHDELFNFLKWLAQFDIPPQEYPKLRLLVDEVRHESEREAYEKEGEDIQLMKLAGQVKTRLAGEEFKTYNTLYKSFRSEGKREEFVKFLLEKGRAKGVATDPYEALLDREKKRSKLKALAGEDFFKELYRLIEKKKESLFQSEEERSLDRKTRELKLLRKLASLEVTREELEEIQHSFSSPPAAGRPHRADARPTSNAGRGREFKPHLRFYELALKRDQILFRNLVKEIKKRKVPFVVVVTGGFHTDGMKTLLKEKGYPYLVISPKIRELGPSPYLEVMLEKDPSYGKYLKTGRSPQTSQIALMDLLSPDMIGLDRWEAVRRTWAETLINTRMANRGEVKTLPIEFRAWRDAIIKILLERGLAHDSEKYTAFLQTAIAETYAGLEPLRLPKNPTERRAFRRILEILRSFASQKGSALANRRKDFQQAFRIMAEEYGRQHGDALRAATQGLRHLDPNFKWPQPDIQVARLIPRSLLEQAAVLEPRDEELLAKMKGLLRGRPVAVEEKADDLNAFIEELSTEPGFQRLDPGTLKEFAGRAFRELIQEGTFRNVEGGRVSKNTRRAPPQLVEAPPLPQNQRKLQTQLTAPFLPLRGTKPTTRQTIRRGRLLKLTEPVTPAPQRSPTQRLRQRPTLPHPSGSVQGTLFENLSEVETPSSPPRPTQPIRVNNKSQYLFSDSTSTSKSPQTVRAEVRAAEDPFAYFRPRLPLDLSKMNILSKMPELTWQKDIYPKLEELDADLRQFDELSARLQTEKLNDRVRDELIDQLRGLQIQIIERLKRLERIIGHNDIKGDIQKLTAILKMLPTFASLSKRMGQIPKFDENKAEEAFKALNGQLRDLNSQADKESGPLGMARNLNDPYRVYRRNIQQMRELKAAIEKAEREIREILRLKGVGESEIGPYQDSIESVDFIEAVGGVKITSNVGNLRFGKNLFNVVQSRIKSFTQRSFAGANWDEDVLALSDPTDIGVSIRKRLQGDSYGKELVNDRAALIAWLEGKEKEWGELEEEWDEAFGIGKLVAVNPPQRMIDQSFIDRVGAMNLEVNAVERDLQAELQTSNPNRNETLDILDGKLSGLTERYERFKNDFEGLLKEVLKVAELPSQEEIKKALGQRWGESYRDAYETFLDIPRRIREIGKSIEKARAEVRSEKQSDAEVRIDEALKSGNLREARRLYTNHRDEFDFLQRARSKEKIYSASRIQEARKKQERLERIVAHQLEMQLGTFRPEEWKPGKIAEFFLPHAGLDDQEIRSLVQKGLDQKPNPWDASFPLKENEQEVLGSTFHSLVESGAHEIVVTTLGPGRRGDELIDAVKILLAEQKDKRVKVHLVLQAVDQSVKALLTLDQAIKNELSQSPYAHYPETEVEFRGIYGNLFDLPGRPEFIMPSHIFLWRNTWVGEHWTSETIKERAQMIWEKIKAPGALILWEREIKAGGADRDLTIQELKQTDHDSIPASLQIRAESATPEAPQNLGKAAAKPEGRSRAEVRAEMSLEFQIMQSARGIIENPNLTLLEKITGLEKLIGEANQNEFPALAEQLGERLSGLQLLQKSQEGFNMGVWIGEALGRFPRDRVGQLVDEWLKRMEKSELNLGELARGLQEAIDAVSDPEVTGDDDASKILAEKLDVRRRELLPQKFDELSKAKKITIQTILDPQQLKRGDLVQNSDGDLYVYQGIQTEEGTQAKIPQGEGEVPPMAIAGEFYAFSKIRGGSKSVSWVNLSTRSPITIFRKVVDTRAEARRISAATEITSADTRLLIQRAEVRGVETKKDKRFDRILLNKDELKVIQWILDDIASNHYRYADQEKGEVLFDFRFFERTARRRGQSPGGKLVIVTGDNGPGFSIDDREDPKTKDRIPGLRTVAQSQLDLLDQAEALEKIPDPKEREKRIKASPTFQAAASLFSRLPQEERDRIRTILNHFVKAPTTDNLSQFLFNLPPEIPRTTRASTVYGITAEAGRGFGMLKHYLENIGGKGRIEDSEPGFVRVRMEIPISAKIGEARKDTEPFRKVANRYLPVLERKARQERPKKTIIQKEEYFPSKRRAERAEVRKGEKRDIDDYLDTSNLTEDGPWRDLAAPLIYRFQTSFLGTSIDTDDLYQIAFESLLKLKEKRKTEGGEPIEKPEAFLRQHIAFRFLEELRKQANKRMIQEGTAEEGINLEKVVGRSPDWEKERLEWGEETAKLMRLAERLPEDQRKIFLAVADEIRSGKTSIMEAYEKVAAKTTEPKLSPAGVKTRFWRARTNLIKYYGKAELADLGIPLRRPSRARADGSTGPPSALSGVERAEPDSPTESRSELRRAEVRMKEWPDDPLLHIKTMAEALIAEELIFAGSFTPPVQRLTRLYHSEFVAQGIRLQSSKENLEVDLDTNDLGFVLKEYKDEDKAVSVGSISLDFKLREGKLAVEIGAEINPAYQNKGLVSDFLKKLSRAVPDDVILVQTPTHEETLARLTNALPKGAKEKVHSQIEKQKAPKGSDLYRIGWMAVLVEIYRNQPDLLEKAQTIAQNSVYGRLAKYFGKGKSKLVIYQDALEFHIPTRRAEVRTKKEKLQDIFQRLQVANFNTEGVDDLLGEIKRMNKKSHQELLTIILNHPEQTIRDSYIFSELISAFEKTEEIKDLMRAIAYPELRLRSWASVKINVLLDKGKINPETIRPYQLEIRRLIKNEKDVSVRYRLARISALIGDFEFSTPYVIEGWEEGIGTPNFVERAKNPGYLEALLKLAFKSEQGLNQSLMLDIAFILSEYPELEESVFKKYLEKGREADRVQTLHLADDFKAWAEKSERGRVAYLKDFTFDQMMAVIKSSVELKFEVLFTISRWKGGFRFFALRGESEQFGGSPLITLRGLVLLHNHPLTRAKPTLNVISGADWGLIEMYKDQKGKALAKAVVIQREPEGPLVLAVYDALRGKFSKSRLIAGVKVWREGEIGKKEFDQTLREILNFPRAEVRVILPRREIPRINGVVFDALPLDSNAPKVLAPVLIQLEEETDRLRSLFTGTMMKGRKVIAIITFVGDLVRIALAPALYLKRGEAGALSHLELARKAKISAERFGYAEFGLASKERMIRIRPDVNLPTEGHLVYADEMHNQIVAIAKLLRHTLKEFRDEKTGKPRYSGKQIKRFKVVVDMERGQLKQVFGRDRKVFSLSELASLKPIQIGESIEEEEAGQSGRKKSLLILLETAYEDLLTLDRELASVVVFAEEQVQKNEVSRAREYLQMIIRAIQRRIKKGVPPDGEIFWQNALEELRLGLRMLPRAEVRIKGEGNLRGGSILPNAARLGGKPQGGALLSEQRRPAALLGDASLQVPGSSGSTQARSRQGKPPERRQGYEIPTQGESTGISKTPSRVPDSSPTVLDPSLARLSKKSIDVALPIGPKVGLRKGQGFTVRMQEKGGLVKSASGEEQVTVGKPMGGIVADDRSPASTPKKLNLYDKRGNPFADSGVRMPSPDIGRQISNKGGRAGVRDRGTVSKPTLGVNQRRAEVRKDQGGRVAEKERRREGQRSGVAGTMLLRPKVIDRHYRRTGQQYNPNASQHQRIQNLAPSAFGFNQQRHYNGKREAAKRFLLARAPGFGIKLTPEEEREGALALVEIFQAGQFEIFEREFLEYFDEEVTRLQKQGELQGIREDIFRFLLDPSPEAVRETVADILRKSGVPSNEKERVRLAQRISRVLADLNIAANEMVITRAATKQLEELMKLDPRVMREAITNVLGRIHAIVSQVRISADRPRMIFANGAEGWTEQIFESLPKYIGKSDRGLNLDLIVMTKTDKSESLKRREEIQRLRAKLRQKYPGYDIKFKSVTESSQEEEILRLYLGVPAAVVFSLLGQELKAEVNQTLRPTGIPLRDLDQAIDDVLALVAITLVLVGNPAKSPEAKSAVARLKTQLADFGFFIQQGKAGNWVISLRLDDFTRHLGLEAEALQARLAAA